MTVSVAMTSSRLYESGTTDFLRTGRRDQALAKLATSCSAAAAATVVAAEKAAVAVATGKMEAAAKEKLDARERKDGAVKAPTRADVAWPRLPVAMPAAVQPSKVVSCGDMLQVW